MSPVTQPRSKILKEILQDLKPGHELVPDGKSHYKVLDPHGELVRLANGQAVTLPSTPSPSNRENIRAQLNAAGILETAAQRRGRPQRGNGDPDLRGAQAEAQARGRETEERAKALYRRFDAWVPKIGGWEAQSMAADLARIAHMLSPGVGIKNLTPAASEFRNGAVPIRSALDAFEKVTEKVEEAENPRLGWFDLVREAVGVSPGTLEPGEDWPFRIELLPIDDNLIVDDKYQRPVDKAFVRRITLAFDERLVGAIDVSSRGRGKYAIIDGQQRKTAALSAGKTTIFCAIYTGMTLAEEAQMFFHKNRDRKAMHPFYHYRARLVAGDSVISEVDRIIAKTGWKVGFSSLVPNTITAVVSVEEAFALASDVREECLTPTLEILAKLWKGRTADRDARLIRGFARFFRVYSDQEIQWRHWEESLAAQGPMLVLGRATDMQMATRSSGQRGAVGSHSAGQGVAHALLQIHNTGLGPRERLDATRLAETPSRKEGMRRH